MERIVAAAHLYNSAHDQGDPRAVPIIVSAPPPARHHNLFVAYSRLGKPDESGFLTSAGRFVNRREAMAIADLSGQLLDRPDPIAPPELYSEDLW